MPSTATIEVIARAVIQREGYLLLTRRIGAEIAFLPGGHIEHGEPAKAALAREIKEELGMGIEIQRFLGVVEHAFGPMHERTHEINLIFECTAPSLPYPANPPSIEPEFEFQWVRVDELPTSGLEPSVIRDQIAAWMFSQALGRFAGTIG